MSIECAIFPPKEFVQFSSGKPCVVAVLPLHVPRAIDFSRPLARASSSLDNSREEYLRSIYQFVVVDHSFSRLLNGGKAHSVLD